MGALNEKQGLIEAFCVDFSSVVDTTVDRNWRGIPKAIRFRGSSGDSFQVVVTEIIGVLSNKDEGRPSSFADFADVTSRLSGKAIEL